MKKILLALIATMALANADVTNVVASKAFLGKNIKIIDVRTSGEWASTGVIKGAYTIMFFDERGEAKEAAFRAKLNKIIKKNEKFAIICRTGARTGAIAKILDNDYDIINLQGGMVRLMQEGYKPVPYKR
ncbi:putative rhodanese-like domain-containing protein [Sulfurovum sp. enrichment culture clone C5]|uniref:Putative rhodanese-like domain-containing protein n=1 Tax=Sulfurovum sp. enrichment culture clone C5 TaxID=497650 RepID=A0A0S4XNF7_9BACT|nr:putative rhodanese-like domain-containing protein [Sulfurovum sp. enrichment culture clone C5]